MATKVTKNDTLQGLISTTTGNLTLIDHETGVQLYSKTLQDIGIDIKEDNKKLQGGIGNPTIYAWGENRQIEISLDDATAKLDFTAAKFGQELQKGEVKAFQEAMQYTAKGGKFDLLQEPAKGVKPQMFDMKTGELIPAENIAIEGKGVTITTTVTDGDVYVNGYDITVTDALYFDIDSDKFAKSFEVIISNPVVLRQADGTFKTKYIRQYRFPSGRLEGSMKDDLKSKSDGGKVSSKIEILKPENSNTMGRVMLLPLETFGKTQLQAMGFAK
ncbi:hypothetical protein [Clostridium perfringens]|uniref:hypothetical protein n=1 Tax=Clostridium perfringens TaxID=1502 RepID=UPI00234111C1|nr:hypothetical protein [Clostridium perfringens]MDC4245513.1 hypothetical protein [Clostridium perfringens]